MNWYVIEQIIQTNAQLKDWIPAINLHYNYTIYK